MEQFNAQIWECINSHVNELLAVEHWRRCFDFCVMHITHFPTALKHTHGLRGEHRKYVKMYEKKMARTESKARRQVMRAARRKSVCMEELLVHSARGAYPLYGEKMTPAWALQFENARL